jgi:lipopolysaccharide export LptBFGC system permease protein LptF
MDVVDIIERTEVEEPADQANHPTTRRVIEPVGRILADKARWNEQENGWDLENGLRVIGIGSVDAQVQREPQPISFYQSNITPEEIALYRSGDWVELLSTNRIDELIARPGSYGQANLLRVKHWRFTQPVMNVILLLLAIPCVLTREPGRLKTAATQCLILTGLGMGSIFLSHQIANQPPGPDWTYTWPALMAWMPIFLFGPLAVFLLDRVKT